MHITHEQIGAASVLLGIPAKDVIEDLGLSSNPYYVYLREGKKMSPENKERIANYFIEKGAEFINGGVKRRQKITAVYEGDDCYLRVLDKIISERPKEVMFLGADERRSTPESIERLGLIRQIGVGFRNLLRSGDTYIMGKLEEYRWMPEEVFVDGDVKVIYGNTVVYFASWLDVPRAIKITDNNIATVEARIFNYLWNEGKIPPETTSGILYDNEGNV